MPRSTGHPQPPSIGEGKRGDQGHIAYLLRQAQAAVRLALDARLAKAGLTSPQFLVLNLLDAYPGMSGADLARIAQVTPQTVNLIVRKLETEGLIERSSHETHGRVLRMQLTRDGHQRLRQCKRIADDVEQRIAALGDARTQEAVRRWLVDVAVQLGSADA